MGRYFDINSSSSDKRLSMARGRTAVLWGHDGQAMLSRVLSVRRKKSGVLSVAFTTRDLGRSQAFRKEIKEAHLFWPRGME